jgi:hypothetical protein
MMIEPCKGGIAYAALAGMKFCRVAVPGACAPGFRQTAPDGANSVLVSQRAK